MGNSDPLMTPSTAAGLMDVILCDIDGTVVNVDARIAKCLNEIGVDPRGQPSAIADSLRGRQKSQFFDLFLSEKFTHLDTAVPEIIQQVRDLQLKTGLPLVFLSGRPSTMRRSTRAALLATGLPFEEILLRPRSQRMRRTTEFKVEAVLEHGYRPIHVLDDDAEILAAFSAAFPEAVLHLVTGRQATPWPD